jgi:2-deoxy-D-gluconate 3-dehydrogenase
MVLDDFRLDNKVAIVTGAGTGLGEGLAMGLAEAGADIVATYNTHPPDALEEELGKIGRKMLAVKADLRTIQPVQGIVDSAVSHFGRLDILVNNAGTIYRAPALEYPEDRWDEVMNVNLKSLFFLCQAAGNQFVKQKSGGKIVNIASMLSFQGGIIMPPYTASKSGVRGLTQLLANEWAKYDINVNAIAPGYMRTSNTEPLRKDPKRGPAILERIPAGRWGLPEDLKGAVVFLASDAAKYVHGYTLAVDGGWLGR